MEAEAVIVETGAITQFSAAQFDQHALEAVARAVTVFSPYAQLLLHFLVEILQQHLPCLDHRFVDLGGEIELELLEAELDLVRVTAVLVDLGDAALEIDTGADGTQHFVARPKHT